jgi:tRNA pseudouridine13 synthase
LIERETRPEQRVLLDFKVAPLPIHRGLDPEQARLLATTRLPLPASRTQLPAEGPIRDLALSVVAEMGLAWEDLRVKGLKDVFFSKGERAAVFLPTETAHDVAADELYPGRMKVTLRFDLPKGAYATLVVKRVTDAA